MVGTNGVVAIDEEETAPGSDDGGFGKGQVLTGQIVGGSPG
jgi:hypothetical protein